MKRTKFLVLALVVAIMLMGAGYAYWTETLELKTTVSTGKVDMYYLQNTATEDFRNITFNSNNAGVATGGIAYSAYNNEALGSANVTINNLYPGATAAGKMVIKNDSTIPLKLRQLSYISTTSADLKDNLLVEIKIDYGNASTGWRTVGHFNMNNTLTLTAAQINSIVTDPGLDVGEDIVIEIKASLANTVEDNELQSFSFTITPVFTQFNE